MTTKTINLTAVYLLAITGLILSSCKTTNNSSITNMVARMEVKEPIDGVCDNSNVIAILPIPGNGQEAAVPHKSEAEINVDLNSNVEYLEGKSDYEDKGMVNLIVNCKGELVRCEIDNKTKSSELDDQIVSVFAQLKSWTAGKINGYAIDTSILYSFTIKDGKITIK